MMITTLEGHGFIICPHCVVKIYMIETLQRNVIYSNASILELVPDTNSKYFVYDPRNLISGRGCSEKILIIEQFSLRKNHKLTQQMEILNDNSFFLTLCGAEVFGRNFFLLLNFA